MKFAILYIIGMNEIIRNKTMYECRVFLRSLILKYICFGFGFDDI